MITFVPADICTAFDSLTVIGTRVNDHEAFLDVLRVAVEDHDTSKDGAPGQHVVTLPESAFETVSCGVGKPTKNPDDYIIRVHREGPKLFLKRKFAYPVKSLAVVVYTRQAYLDDPDNALRSPADLAGEIGDATHIIVAVLAGHSNKTPPVTPFRFVHNLAGGNNEYEFPSDADDTDLNALWHHIDWVSAKAKESLEYWRDVTTVAD